MITVILGYFCVSVLVNRSNVLEMSANIVEVYMQILFKNPGMVFSSIYYSLHRDKFMGPKENQDEEGKIKISRTNKKALLLTIIFFLSGKNDYIFSFSNKKH